MAFELDVNKCAFEVDEQSRYESLFDDRERDALVALAERHSGARYSNGTCARLESCENEGGRSLLTLSAVRFYDFISTNYILMNAAALRAIADEDELSLVRRLLREHEARGLPRSVRDILRRSYLPNVLAVSCVIFDRNGDCILTRRNARVGVGSNHVSVSVTGSVDSGDLAFRDPVKQCSRRECFEELGYEPTDDEMKVVGLVCGETKLQPIALVNIEADSVGKIEKSIADARDFSLENSGYAICSRSQISDFFDDGDMLITEAGRVHLGKVAL